MGKLWKANWEDTKKHFKDWWQHTGTVITLHGKVEKAVKPHAVVADPGKTPSIKAKYIDPEWIAKKRRYNFSRKNFLADSLPVASVDIGPGSLAIYLGAEPGFSEATVWYEPCIFDPEKYPPLVFNPENKWWKCQLEVIKQVQKLSEGNYFVGCPDIIENMDILSAMREPQALMTDMFDRPDWVKEKVQEINKAYFETYQKIYDLIKLEDGSSSFGPFELWGPGKTAKVQCDASAMFSPEMFNEFVVPALTEQCEWLDYSIYHLDGTQAVCHLDSLLAIKELDAIEWTPQAGLPQGGDKRWHEMYKKILKAGKSLQALDIEKKDLFPLVDAIGTKGVYFKVNGIDTEAEAEEIIRKLRS